MSTAEKMMSHWHALREKHEALDKKLSEAYNKHDEEKMHSIKIEKLKIKDEMHKIETQLGLKK